MPLTLPEWVAVLALGCAALQLVIAGRRDLGPLTLGIAGCAAALQLPTPSVRVGAVLVATAVVAAIAWSRAGRHGVGRPGLNGAAVAVVAATLAIPWIAPEVRDLRRLLDAASAVCLVVAGVGAVLALERPGPRRSRPRWYFRVPIR